MKKIQSLATALSIISCLIASDMRVTALGGNAGFWPDDDQNIMMFPSTINNFNLAQIQNASGENPYATFIFGDNTKYGFMLDGSGDNLLNVAYGTGSLGALVGIDMNSSNLWTYDDASNGMKEYNLSSMTFNGMFGVEHSIGEVGVGINFSSSDNDNGNSDDDVGSMLFGINLRREQSLWIFSHLLTSVNFGSGVVEIDNGDWETENSFLDFSSFTLDASLFRHWEIGSETDLMFAAGLGFNSSGIEVDSIENTPTLTSTSIVAPKYTFAVETNLKEWATFRAGVNNAHLLSKTDSRDGSSEDWKEMGTSETSYSLGLGIEYEGFKLDLDLNPSFLTNPVHYITGNNLDSGLATQATITYKF